MAEDLLRRIAERGWSPQAKEEFAHRYDGEIGRYIIYLLSQYGMLSSSSDLRALREHVELRLRGGSREGETGAVEILEEVYVETYSEVFKGKLIQSYVKGYARGEIDVGFLDYLKGVIRNKLFAVIGGERSEKEILDRIIGSKKESTVRKWIGEAKRRFWERARDHLLCYPSTRELRKVDKHIDSITHYFFERFIPERYPKIRRELEEGSTGILTRLLEAFRQEYYVEGGLSDEILGYVAAVPLSRPGIKESPAEAEMEVEIEDKGQELDDRIREMRLECWDKLIRCIGPSPAQLKELERILHALNGEAARDTKVCLACTLLKSEGTKATKEDLRMFLVYYLSNYGASPSPSPDKMDLSPEELTLERIRGQVFTWEEIFNIFGKKCNPARIREEIRKRFERI